jgi:hypothetical protein
LTLLRIFLQPSKVFFDPAPLRRGSDTMDDSAATWRRLGVDGELPR